MTTRNFDSSDLTRLTRDRTQFSFFSQRTTAQTQAPTGVYVRGINPQTGVTAQSSINNLDNGDYTTYYRAFPTTIVSVPFNTLNSVAATTTPDNNTSRDLTGQTYILGFLIHNGAYSNPLGPDNWWIDSVFGSLTPFQSPVWMYEAIEYTTAGGFHYNGVFAYFQALQAAGAKVLVSLGGATFTVADISTPTLATQLAQSICFSLLGQTNSPNPLNWTALTNDAGAPFAFDGIDLDFENPAATDVTTVTTLLSTLRTNAPFKLITCAPQPAYVFSGGAFPSAFNANGVYQAYAAINSPITTLLPKAASPALLDVDNIGNFSQINMQYYNQSPDQYPGGANFSNILAQLGYLCLSATTTNKPLVNIGLLGGNDGNYPVPNPDASSIAQSIVTDISAAQALIVAAIPGTALNQWLNGLMFWESPQANNYAEEVVADIQTINPSIPVNLVLYGGQNMASPGISNPGWTTSNTPPPAPPTPPSPSPNTYTILLGTPPPPGVPNNATVNINLVFIGSFSYSTIINQILFNTGSPTPSVSPYLQLFVNNELSTNLNKGFFTSLPPTLTPSGPNTIMNVSFDLTDYKIVTPIQLITALLTLPLTFGTTGYTLVYGSSNIVYTIP